MMHEYDVGLRFKFNLFVCNQIVPEPNPTYILHSVMVLLFTEISMSICGIGFKIIFHFRTSILH